MSKERLYNPNTRWYIFYPEAIADHTTLTADELNSAVANGLGFNITCAVNQDGSNFDLGDSDTDDSLTFCEVAGSVSRTTANPEITIEVETSRDRREANTANLCHDLLAYRGAEYYFALSVGEAPDEAFSPGDRIKLVRGATDYGAYQIGTGENIRLSSEVANRGDITWNYNLG